MKLSILAVLLLVAAVLVARRDAAGVADDLARARAAAEAIAAGGAPQILAGGLVAAPEPSPRYPFLRHRRLGGRILGGPDASLADKLVVDAATLAERSGPFARALPGERRALAAIPAPGGTAVAVVETEPAPAPIAAWLVVAALGCLVVAAARSALFRRHRVAYLYMLPAAAGMAVLVVVPFLIGCALGFFDHARGEWQFVGLHNFAEILSDPRGFWLTLAVTIAWTAVNVALHVGIGVALALALHQTWLRGRSILRVLLILPWAVPNYITALIWRGMFQRQFGAINALLGILHLPEISWFSHFASAFTANVVTNTWLGFPFMMVVALGALDSIPRELYEAAAVDGAGAWARFRHITLPGLRPALLPAVILGSVWTFNMFNVIYLVSGGKPAGSTDILVTEAYRWAFERGQRYGMAAAYATLIFLILLAFLAISRRRVVS